MNLGIVPNLYSEGKTLETASPSDVYRLQKQAAHINIR